MGQKTRERELNASRNSSIEALRIIAMLLIVGHHFIGHNGVDITVEPPSIRNILFQFLFLQNGSLGIDLFFFISAWFYAGGTQTLRSGFRRIWKLEGTVFPISAALGVLSLLALDGPKVVAVKSLLPILTGEYWYATSYVIFLVLLPFLDRGLRSLNAMQHCALVFVTTVMWGLLGIVAGLDMGKSVWLFAYLYALMTFVRWHCPQCVAWKGWKWVAMMILALSALTITVIMLVGPLVGISKSLKLVPYILLAKPQGIFSILLAASIFFSASHHQFTSRIVNYLASSAFSVYLITEFPTMRTWLWGRVFALDRFPDAPYTVLIACGVIVVIYLACFVIDNVRRVLMLPFKGILSTCETALYELVANDYRHFAHLCLKRPSEEAQSPR